MEGPSYRQYQVWIDPDGQVWIEDPDRGALPLAETLAPGFRYEPPVAMLGRPQLAMTRRIAAPLPWPDTLEGLWALHASLLAAPRPEADAPVPEASLLDLKRAIAQHLFRSCVLCEHGCGVDRRAGERGVCRVGPVSYVGASYVHEAEEREIAPSFCLALTGCSWHCLYCHTADLINRVDAGTPLDAAAHAGLTKRASAPGVHSVSFVGGNPDHHLPAILDWLASTPADFAQPLVWNSNMYGSPELYQLLDGLVDAYVGDFRYGAEACAARLSGLKRCWEPVTRNFRLAGQQDALLIVRLLVLPGHLDCCVKPMIDWLEAELPQARVSLLDQYHPAYRVGKEAPELARCPSPEEIAQAEAWLRAAQLPRVAGQGAG